MSDDFLEKISDWTRYSERCERRVLFLGAGFAVNLGLPTWPQLLERAIETIGPDHREDLEREAALSFYKGLSAIRRIMGKPNYDQWRGETLRPQKDHARIDQLRGALRGVLSAWKPTAIWTTNFDQETLDFLHPSYNMPLWKDKNSPRVLHNTTDNLKQAERCTRNHEEYILFLHGHAEVPSNIIDDLESYESSYESRIFREALVTLLKGASLLSLGSSLDDFHFNRILSEVYQERDRKERVHLALLPDYSAEKGRSLSRLGVIPCGFRRERMKTGDAFFAALETLTQTLGSEPSAGGRIEPMPPTSPSPERLREKTKEASRERTRYEELEHVQKNLGKRLLWNGLYVDNFDISPGFTLESGPYAALPQGSDKIPETCFEDFFSNFFAKEWKLGDPQNATDRDSDKHEELLDKPLSLLLLTGDAGIGKTTALLRLAAESWLSRSKNHALYINLAEVFSPEKASFEGQLDDYLNSQGYQTLSELYQEHRDRDCSFVLLLDSFDEAALSHGASRISILGRIVKFCENNGMQRERISSSLALEAERPIRGVLIATRQRLTYAEKQLLRKATTVSLNPFASTDLRDWLRVFNRHTRDLRSDKLRVEYFLADGKYELLGTVVNNPLVLYLLAAAHTAAEFSTGDVVRNLKKRMAETGAEQEIFEYARFLIMRNFVQLAAKNLFVKAKAFRDLKQSDAKLEARKKKRNLETLYRFASEVTVQSNLEDMQGALTDIQSESGRWIIHALPMQILNEDSAEEGDIQLRFPHYSIAEYLIASEVFEGMVSNYDFLTPNVRSWAGQDKRIQEFTVRVARLPVSDRTFEFIIQELKLAKVAGDLEDDQLQGILSLAEYWGGLEMIIVPDDSKIIERDGKHIACARKDDLGLSISHIGLPLALACKMLVDGEHAKVGANRDFDTGGRYRLRQYLRLSGYHLGNRRTQQADLSRLPFRRIKSHRSTLEGADMIDLVLEDCIFSDSELRNANLHGAKLNGTTIQKNCTLHNAILVGAELKRADLSGVFLESVNMYNARLDGADLREATLRSCNLTDASLVGAKLQGTTFERCMMIGVDLDCAELAADPTIEGSKGATFKNVVLTDVKNLSKVSSIDGATFEFVTGLFEEDIAALDAVGFTGSVQETKIHNRELPIDKSGDQQE